MLTLKDVLPLINTYMKVSFYFTKKQKHMPFSDELFEKYKDTKLEKDSLVFYGPDSFCFEDDYYCGNEELMIYINE